MGLLGRRAAVRVGRRGRQHELDVRPVVRLVTVLGRDERDRLQSYGRRQRAFAQHGVPADQRREMRQEEKKKEKTFNTHVHVLHVPSLMIRLIVSRVLITL